MMMTELESLFWVVDGITIIPRCSHNTHTHTRKKGNCIEAARRHAFVRTRKMIKHKKCARRSNTKASRRCWICWVTAVCASAILQRAPRTTRRTIVKSIIIFISFGFHLFPHFSWFVTKPRSVYDYTVSMLYGIYTTECKSSVDGRIPAANILQFTSVCVRVRGPHMQA